MVDAKIVAIGLLTRQDLDLLGPAFQRAWPLDDSLCFDDLLQAIDDAELERANASPPKLPD